jgi:hypothetical protein
MQRRALQLIAVSCLVALAGCSGALSGVGGDGGPTLEDASYPDGVSDNGTDLAALSNAHAEALNGSSFALSLDVTQNSSAANRSMAVDAAVGPDRDDVRVNVSGANQTMATYATAEKRYLRISSGEGTNYRVTERTADGAKLLPSSYSGTEYLDRFAGQVEANFTPTEVREVDGTTLIVLKANESEVSDPEGTNLTDYDATLLVDERGVIHRFEVSAQTERGGESIRNSLAMTISDVNETTVEEPSWLDEARNQTEG